MKRIYIRVDGNEIIATGHIMRCLSIGEQLRKKGAEVTFITADEKPLELIEKQGFSFIVLNTDWQDMEGELDRMQKLIQEQSISVLLVDSYQVTENYFHVLNQLTGLVYLDDKNAFRYEVSDLIRYGFVSSLEYEKIYAGKDVRLWLGCDYIPLREEFQEVDKKQIQDEVGQVMITTGGTDSYHVSERILTLLVPQYKNIVFHGVVGGYFDNKENLQKLAEQYDNIVLHENITSMSALMKQCDLAISAGGTTLFELCACGLPTICFSIADNQQHGVEQMGAQGIMIALGDYQELGQRFESALSDTFCNMKPSDIRRQFSDRMQRLVDGKGAERIAEILNGTYRNFEGDKN